MESLLGKPLKFAKKYVLIDQDAYTRISKGDRSSKLMSAERAKTDIHRTSAANAVEDMETSINDPFINEYERARQQSEALRRYLDDLKTMKTNSVSRLFSPAPTHIPFTRPSTTKTPTSPTTTTPSSEKPDSDNPMMHVKKDYVGAVQKLWGDMQKHIGYNQDLELFKAGASTYTAPELAGVLEAAVDNLDDVKKNIRAKQRRIYCLCEG